MAFVAVIAVFKLSSSVCIPVVLALFIFFLLFPFVSTMEKHHFPSFLVTVLCLITIVLILIVVVFFISFSLQQFIDKFPSYEQRYFVVSDAIENWIVEKLGPERSIAFLDTFQVPWFSIVSGWIKSLSTKTVQLVKDCIMIVLLLFFLLLERNGFISKILAFSHNSAEDIKVRQFLDTTNSQLSGYMAIKLLVSFSSGAMVFILSRIINLDFPIVCCGLAFAFHFIPTIGPILTVVVTGFLVILQYFPNWNIIMAFLIPSILAELVIVNLIGRRSRMNYLNLSPFVILLSLVLWNYIWGVLGLFLAVPIMSLVQLVMANIEQTKPLAVAMSDFRNAKYHNSQEKQENSSI